MKPIKTLAAACVLIAMLDLHAQTNPFNYSYNGFNTGTIANGRSPVAARLADVDNDGDKDALIAKGNFSSGFAVMLNQGNGFFSDPVHYSSGSFASADIEVADFNGDGIFDVAVTNPGFGFNNNTISVFPGTSNGAFGAKSDYIVNNGPVGITSNDFNNDGYTDLACANNGGFGTGSTISILYNNMSGGFNPAVSITIPGGHVPYKLQSADLNNDSLPDIAVADEGNIVTIFENTSSGFSLTSYVMQNTTMTDYYFNIELEDADNDSDIDIFYSSKATFEVAYRENTGGGNFDSTQMIVLDGIYGGSTSLDIVDFNGDGIKDILATSATGRASDGFRIAFGQGNGNYSNAFLRSAGQYTIVALADDIDLDGDMDVLTIDNYTMGLTVHLNDGTGLFLHAQQFSSGVPSISTKLEAADVDNDGDIDIATSADSRTAVNVPVSVSLNNGNGTFASAITYSNVGGGVGVKLRDLNNDGFADLLYASGINTTPYDYFTALNNGNGTFATPVRWPVNSCGWNDIDGADIDNDGDIDVIITEWLGCPSVPNSNQRIFISYNQGGGLFAPPIVKITNPFPGPIAVCDFNEDGFLDLATGNSSFVDILLNNGSGNFNPPVSFPMSQSPFDILAADLNNDGHIDIASCNYGSNSDYNLTVRLGNGNGSFQAVQLLPAIYCPDLANVSGIAAGDIDNDLDLDLMVSGNASNDICLYINDGLGNFTLMMRAGIDHGVRSPWFADFNNDGNGDIVALTDLAPSGLSSAITLVTGATTGLLSAGAGVSSCSGTVGLNEAAAARSALLWPNPFNTSAVLSFTMTDRGNCIINIYNAAGQKSMSLNKNLEQGPQSVDIAGDKLPSGVYQVEVIAGTNVFHVPAVIQ